MPTYIQTLGGTQTHKAFKRSAVQCDICNKQNLTTFIDGRTTIGPWANMCEACYDKYGTGLGTGLGQKYVEKYLL